MKAFKEWLSDNLRYLMLFFALILGVIVIVMTVRLFQASTQSSSANQQPRDVIIIGTEKTETTQKAAQEAETEKKTEKQTEKKTTVSTEKESEKQSETTKANVVVVKPESKTGETNAQDSQTAQSTQQETQKETQKETQAETQPQTQPEPKEIDTLQTYGSSTTLYAGVESNVRSGPGTEYSRIGGASQGEALTVTGETSGWYQVSYNGQTGYMAKNILVESYTPDYRSILSACNLRSTPDYGDGNVIMELWAGATVEYMGVVEGWAKVSYEGTVGYIGTKFVG